MRTLLELVAQASDNPAFWPIAFVVPMAVLFLVAQRVGRAGQMMQYQAGLLASMSMVLIAAYLFLCWRYLLMPGYSDHVQPTVASISWYFWSGKPVYHDMTSVERYSLPYGPYLFVINGLAEGLLGPSILTSKIAGVLAAVIALVVVFAAVKRRVPAVPALIVVGVYATLLLHFRTYSFWSRPEPFLVLFVAVGLYAAVHRFRFAPVVFGIMVGLCMNLKIHALLYFLPVAALALEAKPSRRDIAVAAGGALVVFVAPFVVFRSVSLSGYLAILRLTSAHGFDMWQYRRVVEWFGAMLFPAAALMLVAHFREPERARAALREHRVVTAALLIGIALMTVPASKYGAGPHHGMPFLPVVAFLTARLVASAAPLSWSGAPAQVAIYPFVGSWMIAAFAGGFLTVANHLSQFSADRRDAAAQVVDDLRSIVARDGASHVLLAGAGSDADYGLTFARPVLAFAGMPIGVDVAALMDFHRAHVPAPDPVRVSSELATATGAPKEVLWVVPRDSTAFTMATFYPPQDPLYDAAFRAQFSSGFERVERTPHFDLYARRR